MNEKINLQELIALLAQKSNITKKEAEMFLKECLDTMHEALLDDRIVKVKNLGTFKLSQVSDRESIDVVTGERVLIPAHYKVNFSAENNLAQIINDPFTLFVPVELNDDDTIVDSGEIISFIDEEEENAQEENELAANLEENDNVGFESVLENSEKTISFLPEEKNDTDQTESNLVFDWDNKEIINFDSKKDMDLNEKEDSDENLIPLKRKLAEFKSNDDFFEDDNKEAFSENKEAFSEKLEIEKPNEGSIQKSFDLTLDIDKMLAGMNVPIEIPESSYDTEIIKIPSETTKIILPPIQESPEPIEMPPAPEPSRPIEISLLPEPFNPVEIPPIQEPCKPATLFMPNEPIMEENPSKPMDKYIVYSPKKYRPRYPRWLITPSYFAIIFGVAFIFYYLYRNLSDMRVSDPPIISSPTVIAENAGNDNKNTDDMQDNTSTAIGDLGRDSLGNALKEKFGDLLVGLPRKTASDKETGADKPIENKSVSVTRNTGSPSTDRPISGNGKIITVRNGQTLTMLALSEYGNKCFWVYIYEENKQVIKNPNNVPLGTKLAIPPPEKYSIDKNNAASIRKAIEKADQLLFGH